MILVKNNLPHSSLPIINETYIQATSILVSVNNHINLTLSSTYCPIGSKISSNNLINFFESLGKHFIVAGDLNAKHSFWGCFSTNTRGRTLHNSIANSNIKILPSPHLTYWPSHRNRRPDILDIFITKIPNNCITTVTNTNDLSSDHSPVILEFEIPSANSPANLQVPGKIYWPTFQKLIKIRTQFNQSLKSSDDIDETIQMLTTDIQECTHLATSHNPTTPKIPTSESHKISSPRKTKS